MTRFKVISWAAGLVPLGMLILTSCKAPETDQAMLEQQAREITQQFTSTLLPTLQQALADGGPVNAIEVCATRAPQIADDLSNSTSWSVNRVSLKARNQQRAIPDSWERSVLERFNVDARAGVTAAALNEAAMVEGEFRFMQAQVAMPLCLTCHGENLSEDVNAALRQHYPDDLATGYSAGDVRGAISLRYRPN